MRLLNTKTYRVEEFYTDIPLYAILSHTWEKGEVTFQDIQKPEEAKCKVGWPKVENACIHARKYKFDYIWIDSCCIDKSSSAELSEALNSMYQYYTDAEVCYVYLCDASSKENPRDATSKFRNSRWFTRGWTLQELVAPMYAVFLDKDWKEIGTKWSLRDVLSAITTIPVDVFEGQDIDEYSVAQRMSWAAYRETTRSEDQAYCLMGIFSVNMPPIYGEGGAKAFVRLQQEIIKISDDRSIFAWMSESSSGDPDVRGLLARSPKEFRASGGVKMIKEHLIGAQSSFSFANNGLHIHLPLVPAPRSQAILSDVLPVDSSFLSFLLPAKNPSHNSIFLASLHCHCPCERHESDSHLSIYLRKIGEEQYVRYRPNEVVVTPSTLEVGNLKEVIIKENPLHRKTKRRGDSGMKKIDLRLSSSAQRQFRLFDSRDLDMSIQIFPGAFRWALLQDRSGELFSLVLRVNSCRNGTSGTVETVAAVQGDIRNNHALLESITNEGLPADRVKLNGSMHVRLQMAGSISHWGARSSYRVLEIDHELATGNHRGDHQLILQPPTWGCTVPLFVTDLNSSSLTYSIDDPESFILESVFPPSSFDRGLKSNYQGHISMPADINVHRLLTYRHKGEDCRFHVVLGLHESGEAWSDVVVSRHDAKEPSLKELWKSCRDSGCCKSKQDSRASVVLGQNSFQQWAITAAVQKTQGSTLQLGSHLLLLNVETYCDDDLY